MTTKPSADTIHLPPDSPLVPYVCYTGHAQDVYSLLPWNNVLISGSRDKTIRVWKLPPLYTSSNNPITVSSELIGLMVGHADNIRAIIAHNDIIASISWDKSIKLWKWNEEFREKYKIGFQKLLNTSPSTNISTEAPSSSETGGFLSKMFSSLRVSKKKTSTRSSPQNSNSQNSSDDKIIHFETSPKEQTQQTDTPFTCIKEWTAHSDWIVSTCFWNGWLCTGGFEGTIGVWEVEDEKKLGKAITRLEKHSNYVGALGVVGTRLWSCGYDGVIKIWNTQFSLEKTIEVGYSLVSFYKDDDNTVYTGCGNGTIYLWNVEGEQKCVLEANSAQSMNSILRWNNLLLTGGESGNVSIWTKENQKEIWKIHSIIKFPKFVKKIVPWKNRIWVSSGNNLYGFKGKTFFKSLFKFVQPGKWIGPSSGSFGLPSLRTQRTQNVTWRNFPKI